MANSDIILHDIRTIIENGRRAAYEAVGHTAIATYWNIGRRIVEEEQDGRERAKYGTQLIKNIAETLVPLYGSNYSKRNLDYYKKFYLLSQDFEIVNTRVHNLDWSHIRRVLSVANEEARLWYLSAASDNEQLFAAKYMAYMPTEEELRREIEHQKQFFLEQHST